MVLPEGANQRRSLDFVFDALTVGRRFRILAVLDAFSRKNLVQVADTCQRGLRVSRDPFVFRPTETGSHPCCACGGGSAPARMLSRNS